MSNEELGFGLVLGALGVGAAIGYILVHTFKIDWFRNRLLSQDRWTRAVGMLPIMVPLYLVVALVFTALKSGE